MSRSLDACLREYPHVLLEAIAEGWGVALTDEQMPEIVDRLVLEMTRPENVARVVRRLTEPEREALAVVAAQGQARAHVLARKYGTVRKLGPGRLEWQQAWREPASAVERLWFLGFLYAGYGADERFRGPIYFIPTEILSILPPLPAPQPVFQWEPAPPPTTARDERDALAHDVLVLLSHVRNQPVRAPKGTLPASEVARLRQKLAVPADVERIRFMLRLCQRAGLLQTRGGTWAPGKEAAVWLKTGDLARRRTLLDAWRNDPDWNELCLVPSLRCEETGWRNDPLLARQAILGFLKDCPVGTWVTLDAFLCSVQGVAPDFMRPDGDYDSWYIRAAQTGHYLTGFTNWAKVEGALIRYVLECPLCWLGVVVLGCAWQDAPADRFMLSPVGAAMLGLREWKDVVPMPMTVRPDLHVIVPHSASWYDRFLLERFARLKSESESAADYEMTMASVRACVQGGVTAEQILAFLRRAGASVVPAAVQRSLLTWVRKTHASATGTTSSGS